MVIQELPESFQVGFTEYDDGGRDTALQHGGVGTKRWVLVYEGLTAAEAAILDAHMLAARLDESGLSAYTFSFTTREPLTYTGVRYQSYDPPRFANRHVQQRTIILVRFP
jgi:hypothetical protein